MQRYGTEHQDVLLVCVRGDYSCRIDTNSCASGRTASYIPSFEVETNHVRMCQFYPRCSDDFLLHHRPQLLSAPLLATDGWQPPDVS